MKSAQTTEPRVLEVRDVPTPEPAAGEALVRIETVGICGSDKHLYLGTHPYTSFPLVQGHEFSGLVDALPAEYEGDLQIGDRVAVEPLISCGACYPCRHDQRGCCAELQVLGAHLPGALQEFVAAPVALLHRTLLDADIAALVEPMSIGVHATKRAKLRGDDTVVVFGAGPIGLSVLFAARESGARLLMVDPLERRLELAARLGSETHQWSDRSTAVQAALDWTDGEGPSVVFDATGLPDAIRAACEAVVRAGRVVIIGQTTLEVTLPVAMFTAKELTILGSQNNSGVFEETLKMVEADPDWVRQMISHRFPFTEVLEAFEFSVANADKTVKVLIEMAPVGSS